MQGSIDTTGSLPPPGPNPLPWLSGEPAPPPAPEDQSAGALPLEAKEDKGRKALDNRRVGARLIDFVLVWLPAWFCARHFLGDRPLIEAFAVAWAVNLTYFFLCESIRGQTFGKARMGLRVMRKDGGAANAQSIAARTVLRFLEEPGIALIALVATGKRRQRLGDLAAGTIVARAEDCTVPPPPSPLRLVYPALWIGAVIAFLVLDPVSSQTRSDFERGLREGLAYRGASATYIDCVINGSRTAVTDDELTRMTATYSQTGSPTAGLYAMTPAERARFRVVFTDCRTQAP